MPFGGRSLQDMARLQQGVERHPCLIRSAFPVIGLESVQSTWKFGKLVRQCLTLIHGAQFG